MANRIQLRRDGAQQWANVNPILAQGELGIELDTSRLKIGDGVTPWNSLKYERPLETESNTANTLVKRDADGNFDAGAITGTLIGNAATATRLANARAFTLTGDMSGSASFDGSANINITAELNYQPGLPHYDPGDLNATGTYTRLTVDSRGRIVTGDNPSTLTDFGIADAQPLSVELTSLAAISGFGFLSRSGVGSIVNRQLTVGSGRLTVTNATGQSANPLLDLADTPVVVGSYNPTGSIILDEPQISVPESGSIHETVNTTEFTVDRYGRLTYAATAPIATATQGTESPVWNNTTAYTRYDKVKNSADRLYEAILDISAGGSEPTHTDSSDTGSWRYLGSALAPQKGLASFNQEDFDVTVWDSDTGYQGGFVSIAAAGVDNWQLQNNRISFADGNSKEDFELDQELTSITGYRGFNYLNYVKVNDTNGNLLFGANNTGDSGAGEIDVNVRSYFSDPNIDLDGALDQLIDKYGDGNLDIFLTQNSASNRQFSIASTNTGTGQALLNISADNDITIYATDVNSRVNVEDYHFQDNVLSTTNSTMVLDPNDDDDVTGLVRIRGDLQVDGTTTTVNSVTTTIQDPIITLGGEDTLTLDDNLDRGIEFRYYDSQERFGFFGWDEDYADSNIWNGTGGYRFLYNATNTNEVFAGTDAAIIAGNLRLTTNTGSTSTTTGTLVVTGGVGISENIYVGGTVDIANDFDINVGKFTVASATGNTYVMGTLQVDQNVTLGNASTDLLTVNSDTTFEDDVRISGPNTVFTINDGTTTKFEVDTDTGNTEIQGTVHVISSVDIDSTLNVDNNVTFNANFDLDGTALFHNHITLDTTGKNFKITNGVTDNFTVLSTNGNTYIRGTLDVTGNVTLTNNLTVNGSQITLGNAATDILTVNSDATFTDNVTVNQAVDFDSTLNVDGAVDFNSTLVVDGQTTIYDSLILQSNNEVFNINNGSALTQFSIDFDNGNTVIGRSGAGTASVGTLTVHGDGTFNRDVTINGNSTVGNASTDTLTVNATTQFTAPVTLAASQDLHVGGNAEIDGNLTVHGTTTTVNSTVVTLDDPIITLGGDTAPTTDDNKDRGVEFRYFNGTARLGFYGWDDSAQRYAFYHNATNSAEVFGGTRSGIDAGSIKLFDTTNSTSSSTGALIVGGGVGIGLDLYVGDDLIVADTGSFGGAVTMSSTLSVADDFNVSTTFTVDAQTGNTFANGTFTVNGNSIIGNAGTDSHTVNGTVQFNHAVTGAARFNIRDLKIGTDASNEISTAAGNLILDSTGGTVNVTDNLDVDLDLNVDGNTKIDGTLTVDGNTTIGNADTDAHVVTGTVQFNQALTVSDRVNIRNLKVGTDAANEISTSTGNLVLDSAGGTVNITDNLTVSGTFSVNGNTTIGNQGTDAHTVNGTVNFINAITSTDITADNIKIGVDGSSEISTTAGNLTLDSATGEVIVDDNLTVNGTFDVDGLTTVTDSVVINAASRSFSVQNGSAVTKFSVITDTGNTDIQGTLNVEGSTVIDDVFNVTGAVDFDSTLTVDGITRVNNTTNVTNLPVLFTPGGAFRVAGGASFAGNVAFGSDIQIYGDFTVDGNVVQKGNQEFRGRVEFSKNENPISLSSNAAIMVSEGGATIAKDLFVGEDIFLGPNNGTKISLRGATGNASFGGTLGVTGITTLTTLNTSTITTTGSTSIGGTLIVGSNAFVVTNTGNIDIAGTLDVLGATVIDDTFNVTGAVDFDSTLNVDGTTTLNAALTQNSTSLFRDNIVLQGASKTLQLNNGSGTTRIELQSTTGNITALGAGSFNSLGVTTNTTIGGTLGVTGQITGNVTGNLTGTADKSNLVNITETATSNLTYYVPFVSTNTGYTEIRTDSTNLTYNPSTNTLQVNNFRSTTDFEVQGNLNITGTIVYGQSQVGDISNHDTDALAEGVTNLYFTNERVDDRVASLIQGGTGISAVYDDNNNLLNLAVDFGEINTDNLTEGSNNLFTTAARTRTHFTYGTGIAHSSGNLSIAFNEFTTDSVVEGTTNLFHTAARVRGSLSAGGDLSYNASTGQFSVTTFKTADARASISASGSLSYNSGTGVISYTAPTYATVASTGSYTDLINRPTLATVATSGAYGDLSGTPTISTFGASLIDDADAATARTTLGLGSAATTSSTAYATAAQGSTADDTNSDLSALYSALNAIGNDAGITTVAALKAALAALTRP